MTHAAPRRTPLYEAHRALKARLVDFHGWEMPILYRGILEEHAIVRSSVGLFDISHMGRVRVQGADRRAFLRKVLTIDPDRQAPGRCRYTFLLTERGTVIDDLIFYAGGPDDLLVVNASNREKDLAWMGSHRSGDVRLVDETFSTALLALQGPRALDTVRKVLGADPGGLGYYAHGVFGGLLMSRTGYTGEDGFEIFLPVSRVREVWDAFIAAGVPPVGLGARDTLRTEAGMPLYGQELDDAATPLEAGLGFAVELDNPDFIGRAALQALGTPVRRLAGLRLESKRIARQGYGIFQGERPVGTVTSGTWGHTVGQSIAMGYVEGAARKPGTALEIDIRGKREKAVVVKLPFYRREK